MIDRETRITVLRLHEQRHSKRKIAKALNISPRSVSRIIRSGHTDVPSMAARASVLDGYIDIIAALHIHCKGNWVRVHEELEARHGVCVPYSTLTAFCRRHGIGQKPKIPAGTYHFDPGKEMQHDTSPHAIEIGGVLRRKMECASVVLCYSRLIFAKIYANYTRFEARAFLTEALQAFGGTPLRCMVDNTSVVLEGGSGKNARISPQMRDFGQQFGFVFGAHEIGHSDRKGRVERPFHYIENNFYAGRTFKDLADLNAQLRAWCERVNNKSKHVLEGATPMQRYATERPALRPLPLHIPAISRTHTRRVDSSGYVNLHRRRYSVPARMIGHRVQVRETVERIEIHKGHGLIAEHPRLVLSKSHRHTLPEHRVQRKTKKGSKSLLIPEETLLRSVDPAFEQLVEALRTKHGGRARWHLRKLHQCYMEYPTQLLIEAVKRALEHGLIDITRIERIVLRNCAGDFFRLTPPPPPREDHHAEQSKENIQEDEQNQDS